MLALVLALVPTHQATPAALWGTVRLPGTASAARHLVGLDASAAQLDGSALIDLLRLAHGNNTGTRTSELIERYVTTVADLLADREASPAGLRLPTVSTPKKDRELVDHMADLMGLRLRERRNVYALEIEASESSAERAEWMLANGIDLQQIIKTASPDAPVPLALQNTDLPLPLPEFWQKEIFDPKHLPLLDITNDRNSSLLYVGLMALDDETLEFLAGHIQLVKHLREEHPGPFATFGRSLRIHGGSVDVPGGASAAPIWEELVGRPPGDAERFVRDLLAKDDGRLAYFYDLVDHLDAGRRAFVMGDHLEAAARPRFVKRVYERAPATPEWNINDRPFYRPLLDAPIVLSFVDVNADGTAGPAWWPSLLERAADGGDWPTRADRVLSEIKERPLDAAWLLEWIFADAKDAANRFRLFRFAQRVLVSAPREDALHVELALRTQREFPALAAALERMGLTDPSLYAALADAALRVTQSSDAVPAVTRWQAALGLLEQASRLHRVAPETLTRLLKSLADVPAKNQDETSGWLAGWFVEQFVPAFAPIESPELEPAFVAALAGGPTPGTAEFSWEGQDYVVDTAGTVTKQVTAIRQSQHAPRLQDLAALQNVRRHIEKGVTSLDELQALTTEMARLQPAVAQVPAIDEKPQSIVRDFKDATAELGKIKKPEDLKRVSKQVPDVIRAINAVADAIMTPLLYAFAATPTDQPSQVIATAWRAHSFLPGSSADRRPWTAIAWQRPEVEPGKTSGLTVRGSYLNLDLPLASTRLPQVPIDTAVPARITGEDKAALVQAITLGPASPPAADEGAAMLAALGKGRALTSQWMQSPPDRVTLRSSLRSAGVDEWRTNVTAWTAERQPDRAFAALRATEVYYLGGGSALPAALGWPASLVDGCPCRLLPGRRVPEDVRGRVGVQAGALDVDLLLRLSEDLAAIKLPPRLATLLLPMMTADWLNHALQVGAYNWEALSGWPNRVPPSKVEDALLHLVSTGLLAPPRGGPAQDHR
ncbi:MAG TPA: hypothetical protein VJN96_06070 [Vicinamibacterales bacterium]|nr:hypothetical protein [Vicinamibacterales bacterium]